MSTESIYQKPLLYNRFLPYMVQLNEESKCLFEDIKHNLSVAVQKSELWPGALYWTNRLNRYLDSMCLYYFTFECMYLHINFCLLMIPVQCVR